MYSSQAYADVGPAPFQLWNQSSVLLANGFVPSANVDTVKRNLVLVVLLILGYYVVLVLL